MSANISKRSKKTFKMPRGQAREDLVYQIIQEDDIGPCDITYDDDEKDHIVKCLTCNSKKYICDGDNLMTCYASEYYDQYAGCSGVCAIYVPVCLKCELVLEHR